MQFQWLNFLVSTNQGSQNRDLRQDRESGDRNTDRKILPNSHIDIYMHTNSRRSIKNILYISKKNTVIT